MNGSITPAGPRHQLPTRKWNEAPAVNRNDNAMRVLVFGNSGSGKSTFARRLSAQHNLKELDLDHVVWSKTEFAKFRPDEEIIHELLYRRVGNE